MARIGDIPNELPVALRHQNSVPSVFLMNLQPSLPYPRKVLPSTVLASFEAELSPSLTFAIRNLQSKIENSQGA